MYENIISMHRSTKNFANIFKQLPVVHRSFYKYVTILKLLFQKKKVNKLCFSVSVFLNMLKFCLTFIGMHLKYYTVKGSFKKYLLLKSKIFYNFQIFLYQKFH